MRLLDFAHKELELAGLFDADSDYGGALGSAVMELMDTFAAQGHSGFSAGMVIDLFARVASWKPLSPLTGEDDEWEKVDDDSWQNKRYSSVFKNADGAYDINGRVFKRGDYWYSNRFSRVPVTFPYTPTTERIEMTEEEWLRSREESADE